MRNVAVLSWVGSAMQAVGVLSRLGWCDAGGGSPLSFGGWCDAGGGSPLSFGGGCDAGGGSPLSFGGMV